MDLKELKIVECDARINLEIAQSKWQEARQNLIVALNEANKPEIKPEVKES